MHKILVFILVAITLLPWSNFTNAALINEAFKNQQSNVQVRLLEY